MTGPLDKPHEWVAVWAHDNPAWQGPHIYRWHGSWRSMLDLMTRWAATRCMYGNTSLWRQSRRGWTCEGGQ